jgi:hypothetical protein
MLRPTAAAVADATAAATHGGRLERADIDKSRFSGTVEYEMTVR